MLKRAAAIAALSFLISSRLEAQYNWGTVATPPPSPIWPNAQTAPDGIPQYQGTPLGNYCVAHKTVHKCVRQLAMLGMPDSDCSPTVQTACGHVKSLHTPHDFLDSLGDFYRIGGFLTDSRTPDQRLKAIFVGNADSDPVTLPWTFTAGQISENEQFTELSTDPPPLHFFLTPPAGLCESSSSCTVNFSVRVQVDGLIELPAPSEVFSASGQPIPYVRCGRMAACSGTEDVPSNWPSHQRVHWGTPATVAAVQEVARRWYWQCSTYRYNPYLDADEILIPQDLAINDISLPWGGLFDVAADWRPTYKGQSSPGHKSHRNGVDIDLVNVSVPSDPSICGPRPQHDTTDGTWKKTALWTEQDVLFPGTKLLPLDKDPGHLRWEGKNQ